MSPPNEGIGDEARAAFTGESLSHHGRGILREGIVAGILGGVILAIWFLIVDSIQGRPLHTPSLLGSLVATGDPEAMGTHPDMGAVTTFTVIHFLLFGIFGIFAANLMHRVERHPWVILGVILLVVAVQAFAISFVTVFAELLAGTLRWWIVFSGNLLSIGAMAWYLWRRHPRERSFGTDREVFEPHQHERR